jgi:eukaryotic-like serine/threonine-protein kinase
MTPTRIGKYRIDGILGTGAMGVVYQGYDEQLGRALAIKTVRKELLDSGQDEIRHRFRIEARAAGRLSHPNIVTVYEFGEWEGIAFLAAEYVDGIGLDQWLKQNRRADTEAALNWMFQLLSALAYAHGRGVIHRDVKPANLLLAGNGQIKLTDFGVARVDASTLTLAGGLVGTPDYMAPEQMRGETVDCRADIYAAGVVLVRLLAGRITGCGGPITDLDQTTPKSPQYSIPAPIVEVLRRALARDPASRFATASEFRDALWAINGKPVALEDLEDATRPAQVCRPQIVPSPEDSNLTHASGIRASQIWNQDALRLLETRLASHIGPIAPLLVRKAATSVETMGELAARLASNIPSATGRAQFLSEFGLPAPNPSEREPCANRIGLSTGISPERVGYAPDLSTGVSEAALHRIEQSLLGLIGPMGPVTLRNARRQPRSMRDLCLTIADSLPDVRTRARFLREVGLE